LTPKRLLVTCDTGFESFLASELRSLDSGISIDGTAPGRVFLAVGSGDAVANILRSRIANHIYAIIKHSTGIRSLDDIYREVKGIDFADFIEPGDSFAIRSERVGKHPFTSIDIARVAGQAVIDSYLQSKGVRLRVNLDEPDVEVYVELVEDRLLVALQLTPQSLHVRGYRIFNHPAALKTTIASALLRVADWAPRQGLLDPMCGGGTILVEAALASKGVEVPCLKFRVLSKSRALRRLYPSAFESIAIMCSNYRFERSLNKVHVGIEINPRMAEGAVINAKNAGVDDQVLILVGDAINLVGKVKSLEHELGAELRVAVFNPPYGIRMRPGGIDKIKELYRAVLSGLRNWGFTRAVFITASSRVADEAVSRVPAKNVSKWRVIHGTLPSVVYRVDFDN